MSELTVREEKLVALGAAIASNCVPCVEYYIPKARKVGLTDIQIREALRIANRVRQVPARNVLEAALARLKDLSVASTETGGTGCGCTGSTSSDRSDCHDRAVG